MKTQVIILAAGYGKRMQSETPKALTMLKGKEFLRHILDTVRDSGICDTPIVVVGQKRELVMPVLGESYNYVVTAIQEEQLGTGHAVMAAEAQARGAENVMVLLVDQPLISKESLQKLANTHMEENAILTLATTVVPDFSDWRYAFLGFGRFIRNDKGELEGVVEVKDATEEQKQIKEVNPADYCFQSEWLWKSLKKLENKNAQGEYYLTDLVGMAFAEHQKIASIEIDPKEALAVNSKEDLEQLEKVA